MDSKLTRRGGIEINTFHLDIKKSKKYLHWQPRISLAKGLDMTIEYFLKDYFKNQNN